MNVLVSARLVAALRNRDLNRKLVDEFHLRGVSLRTVNFGNVNLALLRQEDFLHQRLSSVFLDSCRFIALKVMEDEEAPKQGLLVDPKSTVPVLEQQGTVVAIYDIVVSLFHIIPPLHSADRQRFTEK